MKKKKKIASNAITDNPESQALSLLNKGKYKDAIKLYKKLLQTSDNEQWHQQLAFCYVQRAIAFAAKAMYKEALVLWENYREHSQPPYEAYDHYLIWLIQTNNHNKVQTCLSQLSAEQLDRKYPALATVLGLLILTKHPEFQQYLPQDSALLAHLNTVKIALQAFQDNNQSQLNETLKQLPYRSALRDFRTVLNAVSVMSNSVEQAQTLLAKTPVNSVYFQTARLLTSCLLEGAELAQALLAFNPLQRSMVAEIKGLNKKQQEFIEQFCRQHEKLSDKVQFNIAIQYRSLLGMDLTQPFCQTLLANYPAGKKDFNKHFGSPDDFEENRIKALHCEHDNNSYEADYYWRKCLTILDNEEANNDLKMALILRHMAAMEPEKAEHTKLLVQSLAHDASDRNSYLYIIQYYSQQPETAKDYKLWLSKTLEQFPQDVEVLTQATKAATRNKTYKKASQYAAKILKIDPLNTFAKQTLFSSHVAHAQRLMREKTYRLVEKEISLAEKLTIGKTYHQQTRLMRALFCFANEDKQQGLQRIVETLNTLHKDSVNMHFQGAMEALLNGLPVATILRELAPVKEHLLSVQELTGLIKQLNQYATNDDHHEYLKKALDKIKAPLKKSLLARDYDEALLLGFCKVLDTVSHFELLRHYAKFAQAKWKKPIWMYYRVYADNNGNAEDCSYMEVQRLQFAITQTREDKDYQAGLLIEKFLESYYEAHPQRGMGFLEELFGVDDDEDKDFEDAMENLFGHIPENILIEISNKAESISKKLTPDRLIQELMEQAESNETVLMAMMQNPDIFSAMLIIKAAKELNIDIDVDVDDVIEAFGISDHSASFPFPFPF